jgi:flagellar biogenesis protein FliO
VIHPKRKILLSVTSIILIISLITIKNVFFNTSKETDLVQLLSEKNINKENTIQIIELESEAIVLAKRNNNLQTLVYLKKERNGETRYVIRSETEEKNFFSDSYTFPGIKSFEEMQNTLRLHASKSVLKEQKGVIYPTITPSEKKLKVNGQTANKIIEYKKNNRLYYFLLFENIDYSQEIHASL